MYWIAYYKSNVRVYGYKYGYNLTNGGATFTQKKHLTKEHKLKISRANKGKVMSEEQKQILSKIKKGSKPWICGKTKNDFSEKHKQNLILGQAKRRNNPGYIPPMLGKKDGRRKKKNK